MLERKKTATLLKKVCAFGMFIDFRSVQRENIPCCLSSRLQKSNGEFQISAKITNENTKIICDSQLCVVCCDLVRRIKKIYFVRLPLMREAPQKPHNLDKI